MKTICIRGVLCILLAAFASLSSLAQEPAAAAAKEEAIEIPEGSRVHIEHGDEGYQLFFNDEPYFIKGAGYKKHMDELVAAGANSIRTWSASNLKRLLDQAQENGLTVCVGLWLGQERHGFDYGDPEEVARQLEKCRFYVNRYKNHPALLLWGVGNEAEWITGTNALVYQAINDIAKMIEEEDPHHPQMTVIGEIGTNAVKVSYLQRLCPNIDILGINSFGGLRTLPRRLEQSGWIRPYVVTEFGPLGPWEAKRTAWGAELEQTTTAKGPFYYSSYMSGILGKPNCLGSYVFLWGFKHEATPTWFSMFTLDGEKFSPVEYMTRAWSGKWPANRAPEIAPIVCTADRIKVSRNKEFHASVVATDPDNDPLTYRWELVSETKRKNKDRTTTTVMKPIYQGVKSTEGNRAVFKSPKRAGMFRLFVYVTDGNGNAASANMPFFVK